ncbi:MAG: PQQ-dependent sugar dehydrogenase [Acidobacteriota bacterium]|nr:PQQ-dependent sugar dehydrogenase [Acidobacteriota bacterium]
MKPALLFLLSALLPLTAADHFLPHVTQRGGNFTTTVIMANTGDVAVDWTIQAYTADGATALTLSGSLPAGQTQRFSQEDLFGEANVSHFQLTAADELLVDLEYRAVGENRGPAHVDPASLRSSAWRIYPGNTAVTWDGLAIVNTGDLPTDIWVLQRNAAGELLERVTAAEGLAPNGKALYVLGPEFTPVDGAYYEIVAGTETAITALRGAQDGSFFWSNPARPVAVSPDAVPLTLERAFPKLFFDAPVELVTGPIDADRFFAVSKSGTIRNFTNDSGTNQSNLFLDITERVSTEQEMGLLGLAFASDAATTGHFYVYYTSGDPRRSHVARFTSNDGFATADPNSELRLLSFDQPFANHNGGQITFGPDGFLYIASGDGGDGGDPFGNGQDRSNLLGTILRIDVTDGGANLIPASNPFVGNQEGFREEIYAYGLRNPWRIAFDGDNLWAGDVGQGEREEINLIVSGGNYGWNITEGNACFAPPADCDKTGLIAPLYDYNHDEGDRSVTGGYVYRGARFPSLHGAYIFGDFVSGRVWALTYNGQDDPKRYLLAQDSAFNLVSFGVDAAGELYLVGLNGAINRFVLSGP